MKKVFVFIVLLLTALKSTSQAYYNEWIDYSKTYYKFKIGTTALYRINIADLNTIGLGNTPVQNFQLWRNGKEVPLYTISVSGALGTNGYLEFWGLKNDGITDNVLYRIQGNQLSNQESFLTDTAAFFQTIKPA